MKNLYMALFEWIRIGVFLSCGLAAVDARFAYLAPWLERNIILGLEITIGKRPNQVEFGITVYYPAGRISSGSWVPVFRIWTLLLKRKLCFETLTTENEIKEYRRAPKDGWNDRFYNIPGKVDH